MDDLVEILGRERDLPDEGLRALLTDPDTTEPLAVAARRVSRVSLPA